MSNPTRGCPTVAAVCVMLALGTTACDEQGRTATGARSAAPSSVATQGSGEPASSGSAASDGGPPAGRNPARTSCEAPSLEARGPLDARHEAALIRCPSLRTGEEAEAKRCGQGEPEPEVDWARLRASVLAFDESTRRHVRAVAARGLELGRNPRAFGQVGDSMTASGAFMRPFSASNRTPRYSLGPTAAKALRTELPDGGAGTIIDFYRGQQAQQVRGLWCDAFAAVKAAKVGARSSWAIVDDQREQSPVAIMARTVSPAIALLTFGGNDAAYRVASPDQVARTFERDLEKVIEALERRGVVPILSTIARHGRAPNLPDCHAKPDELSNWRLAVQTNAVSAAAARVACRRHLPLVDLRHALDATPNFGLGSDGVHPTAHEQGGGVLTRRGLQCGYNVRNFVSLLMLAQVRQAIAQNDG